MPQYNPKNDFFVKKNIKNKKNFPVVRFPA